MRKLALLVVLLAGCSIGPAGQVIQVSQLSGESLVAFGYRAGAYVHSACTNPGGSVTVVYVFSDGSTWSGSATC